MGHALCNMSKLKDQNFVECGESAIWKHPRWPTGMFCEACKEDLSAFFHTKWTRIKEVQDGKG